MSTQTLPAALDVLFLQQQDLQRHLNRQFATYCNLAELSIEMAAALRRTGRHQQLVLRWYQVIAPLLLK